MKVIDLFSGVGGLSLGFKNNGFEVVLANEINKNISYTYKKNFPKTECLVEDVNKIDLKKNFSRFKNKISLIVGGPPCQGMSQKGQRKWLEDDRNFLFKKFLSIVEIVSPEFVLIENVPNLITAHNGYFVNQIKKILLDFSYDSDSKIIKAENFGVPQKRKRAFILCRKNKLNFKLPETNNKKTILSEAIDDLPVLASGQGDEFTNYNNEAKSEYQKLMRRNSLGVWNHVATKHSRIALSRMKFLKIDGSMLDLPKSERTKSIHSGTWSRMNPNSFSKTITTRFDTPSSGQFTLPFQDRCITVREAARIQSFPDSFIFYGKRTSQMIQVGNAVPPLLSDEFAKVIKKNL
jgi:DNA (cytosine-5)-methyltransferase 1